LSFLRSEDCLALCLGLTGYLRDTLCLSLAGSFGRLRRDARGDLRLFLGFTLCFFLQSESFRCLSSFDAQPGLFAGLRPGSREIPVFCSMKIGPGIERCDIIRSGGIHLVHRRFGVGHGHLHISVSLACWFPLPETVPSRRQVFWRRATAQACLPLSLEPWVKRPAKPSVQAAQRRLFSPIKSCCGSLSGICSYGLIRLSFQADFKASVLSKQ
jgi:hypothetical protein